MSADGAAPGAAVHWFDLRTVPATPWKNGGGSTRELVCWPPGAGTDAFGWRVSVARIAAAGPFFGLHGGGPADHAARRRWRDAARRRCRAVPHPAAALAAVGLCGRAAAGLPPDWRAIDRLQPDAAPRPVARSHADAARHGHRRRHRGRAVHGAAGPMGGVGRRCSAWAATRAGPVVARSHGRTGCCSPCSRCRPRRPTPIRLRPMRGPRWCGSMWRL